MALLLGCLTAWLLGGIPFGLVIVRLVKGVDIRTIGSGNVGATNAARAFGSRARLPVFLGIYVLDGAKGFVPAALFPPLFGLDPMAGVAFGACAVLGHCASPFLRLKGGKGVATTTGVFAAVALPALLIALGIFGLVFALTRHVWIGSLALGLALPLAVVALAPDTAFGARLPVTAFAMLAAVLLFVTHRSNLRKAFARRREATQ